ncbi:MAG TPA: IS5 family transposase [Chloroflexia bacterium]|nr:IS5 family transposase [Chloroflexia bacterium]
MAKPLLTDELWEVIEPLLPPEPPKPRGGRPRISNRAALTGILFVLRTGLQWEMLPQEMGCGSGMTCWRRLRDWHKAGVWEKLHQVLLDKLNGVGEIGWERASLDSASIRAKKGGQAVGANPTDKGKPGTKRHLVVCRAGIPLAIRCTAANVADTKTLEMMVDAIPAIKGRRGRPRRKPDKMHADKGYDSKANRRVLRKRGITPRIARRGAESSEKLGKHRWVVERTFAWLNHFRRLTIRYERRLDIHEAFLELGCALICTNYLPKRFC